MDSAPSTLNTLREIATALGNDANFATTITNLIASKQALITVNSPLSLTIIYFQLIYQDINR